MPWSVGETEARHNVVIGGRIEGTAIAILAREFESSGREIYADFFIVDLVGRLVVLITDTKIEGQVGTDLIVVLRKVRRPATGAGQWLRSGCRHPARRYG